MSPDPDAGVKAAGCDYRFAFEIGLPGTCSDRAFVTPTYGGEESVCGEGVDSDGFVGEASCYNW